MRALLVAFVISLQLVPKTASEFTATMFAPKGTPREPKVIRFSKRGAGGWQMDITALPRNDRPRFLTGSTNVVWNYDGTNVTIDVAGERYTLPLSSDPFWANVARHKWTTASSIELVPKTLSVSITRAKGKAMLVFSGAEEEKMQVEWK